MNKPFGVETRFINGVQYGIWRNWLKSEMTTDGDTNPILWFAKDLTDHDLIVCGVPTKKEAIDFITSKEES